ncbi:uncharacterized protein BN717_00022 [Clostridium sp. CAG:575]|nr:uncharacterized protein BN717_00022 [Clostridium sp. CAG:575]
MDNPQYILNEVNKGIKMGMDSISTISEKVGDNQFKDDLLFQYDKYNEILNRVNSELKNYDDFPKELPPMQKTMGYIDIQMSTLTDKSNSHIAEMLIKGTNMGIIEGVKLKNHNPEVEPTISNILDDFIRFQENNVEQLKKYL